MNTVSRPLLAGAALAVGLVGGWLVRGTSNTTSPASHSPAPALPNADVAKLATTLVNDATLADGPNLGYFDFVSQTAALSPEEMEQLLNALLTAGAQSQSDQGLNAGLGCVLQRLAAARPALAGKWLLTHLDSVEDELADRAWKLITSKDPASLTQLKSPDLKPEAKALLAKLELTLLSKSNPAAAVAAAMSQADDQLLKEAMAQWQQQNPDESFAWAIAQPPVQLGRALLARCGQHASETEFKQLLELIPRWKSLPGDALNWQPLAESVVAQLIKHRGIETAQTWVEQLPLTALKLAIQQEFSAAWLKQNAAQASQWIASLPPSAEREVSILALVSSIQGTDPERAFGWAKQLQNEVSKSQAMKTAMQQWLKQQPVAAAKALEMMEPEFRELMSP